MRHPKRQRPREGGHRKGLGRLNFQSRVYHPRIILERLRRSGVNGTANLPQTRIGSRHLVEAREGAAMSEGTVTVSRVGKGQTGDYIGRPFRWLKGSPLANPYRLSPNETEAERAECIARYEAWLRERLTEYGPERAALDDLIRRYQSGEDINLLCWCKPKACHGDVVARLIAEEVQR